MPLSSVADNPYFSAGAGLYGIGMGLMFLRQFARVGKTWCRRRFLVSVDVTNRDPSYQWIMEWSADRLRSQFQHMAVKATSELKPNERVQASFHLAPAPGVHFFMHQGRPMWMNCTRHTEKSMGPDVLETFTLTTIGRSRTFMEGIVEEAMRSSITKDQDKTVLYYAAGSSWVRFNQPRRKRPLDSVILEPMQQHRLVEDVRRFLGSAEDYLSMGIPYRRGYLLHGPPGCGKSSFIFALAGEVEMAICLVNLSSNWLSDDNFNALLNSAPQPSIILLEDIDSAFRQRESRVTYSGILNALDGVGAQEGRILFMTTNHLQRLEPALIRPGRVDVMEEVGRAGPEQIELMFSRFFPDMATRAQEFSSRIPTRTVSMAHLQGYLFARRDRPGDVWRDLDELINPE